MLGKNRIGHTISESRHLTAINHNKQVDINRNLINHARLINVVCFLGKQELAFRRHPENESSLSKRNYYEILDFLAKEEQFIREHFSTNSFFKVTSHDIQNYLIHCVTEVSDKFYINTNWRNNGCVLSVSNEHNFSLHSWW